MYDILWSTYLDPCGTWWSAGFPAQCRAENSRSLGLRGTDYWAWMCHLCRLSHRRWCLPDLLTQHYCMDNVVSVAILWTFLYLKKKTKISLTLLLKLLLPTTSKWQNKVFVMVQPEVVGKSRKTHYTHDTWILNDFLVKLAATLRGSWPGV